MGVVSPPVLAALVRRLEQVVLCGVYSAASTPAHALASHPPYAYHFAGRSPRLKFTRLAMTRKLTGGKQPGR